MILFANGDSHTYGEGVYQTDPTFASIVAEHMSADLVNRATPGGSNACILRTSNSLLVNNKSFLLIGWTSWERKEWLYENHFYNINSTGCDNLPLALHERYKKWVRSLDYDSMCNESHEWHEKIWYYHRKLNEQGVRHLFFNSFTPFLNTKEHTIKRYNWDKAFINPYESSYYEYLNGKGHKPDEHYHFNGIGHKAWGEYLIQYITEHNL